SNMSGVTADSTPTIAVITRPVRPAAVTFGETGSMAGVSFLLENGDSQAGNGHTRFGCAGADSQPVTGRHGTNRTRHVKERIQRLIGLCTGTVDAVAEDAVDRAVAFLRVVFQVVEHELHVVVMPKPADRSTGDDEGRVGVAARE